MNIQATELFASEVLRAVKITSKFPKLALINPHMFSLFVDELYNYGWTYEPRMMERLKVIFQVENIQITNRLPFGIGITTHE